MRFPAASLLGLLLAWGAVPAEASIPVGVPFQVNSYTTGWQGSAAVASDAQGNFVVVWVSFGSYGTDTDRSSIQGQRYDANGTRVGGQFQVNSYTTSYQSRPAVAIELQGSFVVVWSSRGSYGSDSSGLSIQAQLFDPNGTPVGDEFQVNSYTTGLQAEPSVAADAEGRFVVVWSSRGSFGTDTDILSIQGQRYDFSVIPLGGQFQINTYTTSRQSEPSVAADAEGRFVVVWYSTGSHGTDLEPRSIQARRYNADGSPVEDEFQVNSYTTGDQVRPAVTTDAQGHFVVVWESDGSYGTDTDRSSIQAQRYDAAGNTIGGEFQVNSYTSNQQYEAAVAADAEGNFVVVWARTVVTDTSPTSIQGQRYDSNSTKVGGQFQVNSYTTSQQCEAAVAADAEGNFVVVWTSNGSHGTDTDSSSIQGKRSAIGASIFTDSFESGDTSAWSGTVP